MRWLVFGWVLLGASWAQPLVVIDPGHGGRDPGAVGCGNREANAVVDIGRRIDGYLERANIRSDMTQDDNTFVELRARATFANNRNARLFVSVHANANAGNPASGSETWIANGASNTSRQLAGRLQAGMIRAWGLRDRGVKSANFTVLTATSMPAALIETGFINHCENDSRKLADANQRDAMALSQANAIAAQLGVDGPGNPGPAPQTGVLRGVVFEDVGAGLDDPSRRLAGARVRVEGTEHSMRSEAETGGWRFDVEPGNYTITANLDGFRAASRDCVVMANQDTWCSIGLQRQNQPMPLPDAAVPDPDAGVDPPDAFAQPDLGEEPPEGDDWAMPQPDVRQPVQNRDQGFSPDSNFGPDGGVIDPGGGTGLPPPSNISRGSSNQSGGCATTTDGGWAWMLLLLLAWPRRGAALAALLMVLPQLSEAHVPEVPEDGNQVVDADHDHTFSVRMGPPQILIRGDWRAPRVSPDGRSILLDGRDGLYMLRDGKVEKVTRPIADAVWLDDARFGYRSPDQRVGAVPLFGHHVDGTELVPQPPDHGVFATIREDQVHVFEHGVRYRISPPGDRFFAVRVSPTGEHIAYWGLKTGLSVYAVHEGRTTALGSGGHPNFDPRGEYLFFERTTDEGAALTGADIFALRLADGAIAPLSDTPDHLELAPSFGGGVLVYREGDAIVARPLALP